MNIRFRKYFSEFLPRNASSRLLRSICVAVAMRAPCFAPCFFGSICSCSVYRSSQHVRTFRSMRMRVSFIICLHVSPSRALSLARPLSPRVLTLFADFQELSWRVAASGAGLQAQHMPCFNIEANIGISQKLTIHSYIFFFTNACLCLFKLTADAFLSLKAYRGKDRDGVSQMHRENR